MPQTPSDFGVRLRELREKRGFSQRDLSLRAGLSPSMISFIESGHVQSPQADTIEKIATALDVSVAAFFPRKAAKGAA